MAGEQSRSRQKCPPGLPADVDADDAGSFAHTVVVVANLFRPRYGSIRRKRFAVRHEVWMPGGERGEMLRVCFRCSFTRFRASVLGEKSRTGLSDEDQNSRTPWKSRATRHTRRESRTRRLRGSNVVYRVCWSESLLWLLGCSWRGFGPWSFRSLRVARCDHTAYPPFGSGAGASLLMAQASPSPKHNS